MEKPKCKLVGSDGNVFSIISSVSRCLKDNGMKDKIKEFQDKAMKSESYDEVLRLCSDYVEVI